MTARERPRCGQAWMALPSDLGVRSSRYGHQPPGWHTCARPPVHPTRCSCYCGEKP